MLLINEGGQANYVDQDETALREHWSGSTLFGQKAFKTFQQTTRIDDFSFDWRFKG